jgi:DNA polymerase-3 subunit alpha
MTFIHLKTHSTYSLSEGAVKVKELAAAAQMNKMPAIAITDSNNLFCSLEFSKECLSYGIQPIIGCILHLDVGLHKNTFHEIVLYAKDKQGYKNLLKLVSKSYLDTHVGTKAHIKLKDLEQYNQGLIVLTGSTKGTLNNLILESSVEKAQSFASYLKKIFGDRLYIELSRHGYPEEEKTENQLIDIAYKLNIPIVATNEVFYLDSQMYEAHDALICIAEGRYVIEENRRRLATTHYFKSDIEMRELFADIPEAIENTLKIAKRCYVMSEQQPPMLPQFAIQNDISEEEELRTQAKKGLDERLNTIFAELTQEIKQKYFDRLDYELDIITKMNFSGYFLIVSDFIKWSKSQNIPVGPGRGSGAGSVVAWSLYITDLDPIKFGLFFERFLNPERISMPDFDIDFCQERREEVIHYVTEKYGKDRVAQIITFGKLQPRAVIRDVGRVLQLPYGQVDRISKMVPFNPVNPLTLSETIEVEPELRKAIQSDPQVEKLISIALKLEGLNRHASTHAAGIVISGVNLEEIVPLYKDDRSDMSVVQYSMKYAEMAGLVKFDFLGLKTLTVISKTVNLIKEIDKDFDIDKISYNDLKIFEMLAKGDSSGVFQFESPGMKDALRKLKPDTLDDIIALGALYRPGPMDNIPRYIACKHGLEKPDYLHPKLENLLKETFGVIIYQEQVMEIAQLLAGYTLGEADLLRRAMGKKIKEEMDAQREIFVTRSVKLGLQPQRASEIFDLVAKFAGYGFNKAHAAAYGVISYQTAYLKANYTVQFLTATLNLDIHDTDKISLFCEEAKYFGISLLPPDINKSDSLFKIEIDGQGKEFIRYGLGALKGVGVAAMDELVLERQKGLFKDLADFANRCSNKIINKRQLEGLIKAGAFASLNDNSYQLLESVDNIIKFNGAITKEVNSSQINLFGSLPQTNLKLELFKTDKYWNKNEKLNYQLEVLGFYLTEHPLTDLIECLQNQKILQFKDLAKKENGFFEVKVAGIIISTKTRMAPRGRYVSAQVSDPSGLFDVSIFDDDLLKSSRDMLDAKQPLIFEVEAKKDEGGIRLIAKNIKLLANAFKQLKGKMVIYCTENLDFHSFNQNLITDFEANLKIHLCIVKEAHKVLIELPGKFFISPEILANIKNFQNILHVEQEW